MTNESHAKDGPLHSCGGTIELVFETGEEVCNHCGEVVNDEANGTPVAFQAFVGRCAHCHNLFEKIEYEEDVKYPTKCGKCSWITVLSRRGHMLIQEGTSVDVECPCCNRLFRATHWSDYRYFQSKQEGRDIFECSSCGTIFGMTCDGSRPSFPMIKRGKKSSIAPKSKVGNYYSTQLVSEVDRSQASIWVYSGAAGFWLLIRGYHMRLDLQFSQNDFTKFADMLENAKSFFNSDKGHSGRR